MADKKEMHPELCEFEKCRGWGIIHTEMKGIKEGIGGFRKTVFWIMGAMLFVTGMGWAAHTSFADKLTTAMVAQGALQADVRHVGEDVRELRQWIAPALSDP